MSGKSFDKTKFALGVLTKIPSDWSVPRYIKEGLKWLDKAVAFEQPQSLAAPVSVNNPPVTVTAK